MSPDCFGGFVTVFFGGFLNQITNYDRKERYSRLAIGWNIYYVILTYYTLVDGPSAMTPWGIYPGRKIPALTWGPLNNVEPVSAKSEPPPNNPPENNVEPVPAKSEMPPKQSNRK
jgi:hypothetical protein